MESQSPPSQSLRSLSEGTSACKGLISYVRTLPKESLVWIQGTVVGLKQKEVSVDDGSAIARVQFNPKRDSALNIEALCPGAYIMVIGLMSAKLKGYRMGMRAFTVRDLTPNAVFLETLWNLEVVDAYLYRHSIEKEKLNIPSL